MAKLDSLEPLMIDELRDLLDAEKQITKALPKMAKAAASPQLRSAFELHLDQTEGQIDRLNQVFEQLGERAHGKTCVAMKSIIEEGQEMMKEAQAGPTRDALLIAAAQKVEHYEIASYGTARTYATQLGHRKAATLLEQTLKEEKAADQKLTSIAESSSNPQAAREGGREQEGGRSRNLLASAMEWSGFGRSSDAKTGNRSGGRSRTTKKSSSAKSRGRKSAKK